MANRTARRWPGVLPVVQLVSGVTPLPAVAWVRRMLSPAVRTMWAWCRSRSTVALAMVLGMSSSNPPGVKVARQGDGAFLVGGVDDAVERLGGLGGDWEQADVVDHDDVGAHDPLDRFGGGVGGAVAADERAEVLETEPGDFVAGIDGGLAERFKEVGLACA